RLFQRKSLISPNSPQNLVPRCPACPTKKPRNSSLRSLRSSRLENSSSFPSDSSTWRKISKIARLSALSTRFPLERILPGPRSRSDHVAVAVVLQPTDKKAEGHRVAARRLNHVERCAENSQEPHFIDVSPCNNSFEPRKRILNSGHKLEAAPSIVP